MTETLKGFPPLCWNCGKELSGLKLVHNEHGGDSVICTCSASTTPLLPGQLTVKAPKEQIEVKSQTETTPAKKSKTTKKT